MITHMCVEIRGALWNRSYLRDGFKHPDGRAMTSLEAFNALCDELAKGRQVLPLGPCDNFDYQQGCLGHPDSANEGAK